MELGRWDTEVQELMEPGRWNVSGIHTFMEPGSWTREVHELMESGRWDISWIHEAGQLGRRDAWSRQLGYKLNSWSRAVRPERCMN